MTSAHIVNLWNRETRKELARVRSEDFWSKTYLLVSMEWGENQGFGSLPLCHGVSKATFFLPFFQPSLRVGSSTEMVCLLQIMSRTLPGLEEIQLRALQ